MWLKYLNKREIVLQNVQVDGSVQLYNTLIIRQLFFSSFNTVDFETPFQIGKFLRQLTGKECEFSPKYQGNSFFYLSDLQEVSTVTWGLFHFRCSYFVTNTYGESLSITKESKLKKES